MEIRTSISQIRTRNIEKEMIISGYAVKWDKWSKKITEKNKSFYERIKRGAFLDSLENKNQIALLLHSEDFYLGSVREKTLFLEEDEIGLCFKLILPDNRDGKRVFSEAKRGKLKHASFTFLSNSNFEEWETREKEQYRTINRAELKEISPVYNPAYPDSIVVEGDHRTRLLLLDKIDRISIQTQINDLKRKINEALKV